jgi:hypothetical protein
MQSPRLAALIDTDNIWDLIFWLESFQTVSVHAWDHEATTGDPWRD